MAVDIIPTSTDGTDLRIGIVVSRFNEYAGRGEFEACMDELRKLGVMDEDVTKVSVPGALEIPFALMKLAQTEEYDALIALGAVIRGETYHLNSSRMSPVPALPVLVLTMKFRSPMVCLRRKMTSSARNVLR